MVRHVFERLLDVRLTDVTLPATLAEPGDARGLVVFAHGAGVLHRTGNRQVAAALNRAGFATLLYDLLTSVEELSYELRFDIALLSRRVAEVTRWVRAQPTSPRCRSDTSPAAPAPPLR